MRCGGGGTHWWTKAHIAYVGVVGLLTNNLDDHQLEEGRSELGVTKTSVFVFVFAYVGETNNIVCMRQGRIMCLLNSSCDGANKTSRTDGVVGGSHLSQGGVDVRCMNSCT